ncbi:MAG: efflux family protein [Haloplasmataceae bacterium]|jgi:putative MATE family efflux protein|nr:efflux family protein [Haloplasmataceae bacterium]
MKFKKTIMLLTLPIIIEMFLETAIGYINVSMLGKLGKTYLSAASVADNLVNTCLVLANTFSLGGTVLVAKFIGSNEPKKRNQAIGQTISIGIIFSVVFYLIFLFFTNTFLIALGAEDTVLELAKDYMSVMIFTIPILMFRQMFVGILRGMGKTKVPMFLSAVNIVLNYLFNLILIYDDLLIFGFNINAFGLSIKGAALATLLSRSVALIILIFYFIKIAKFDLKIKDFIFSKKIINGIFNVAIPSSIEMMIMRFGMMYYFSMVAQLGDTSIAAHAVANQAESISYTPGNAFNVVIVTLVGQYIGNKKYDLAKESLKQTDRMAIVFMGFFGLLFLTVPGIFVTFFTNDKEVFDLACKVLRVEALAQIFFARYYVYSGFMRTIGKSKQIFFVTSSSVWLVRIVLTHFFLKYTDLGLVGAWIPMFLDYVYRAIFITILVKININKVFPKNKADGIQYQLENSLSA